MDAIVDTTVVLHLYRKYQPAIAWFNNQRRYGATSITWLEVMGGASNKANQAHCKWLLSQFDILYPTAADQQWAMQQLERFQFSHHIGKDDCLIASLPIGCNYRYIRTI
jgi:predicted nucleic acid-binding protein